MSLRKKKKQKKDKRKKIIQHISTQKTLEKLSKKCNQKGLEAKTDMWVSLGKNAQYLQTDAMI